MNSRAKPHRSLAQKGSAPTAMVATVHIASATQEVSALPAGSEPHFAGPHRRATAALGGAARAAGAPPPAALEDARARLAAKLGAVPQTSELPPWDDEPPAALPAAERPPRFDVRRSFPSRLIAAAREGRTTCLLGKADAVTPAAAPTRPSPLEAPTNR
jgi:hypothetical protein